MSLTEKLTSIKANLSSAMSDINTALVAKGASEVTTLYAVPTAIESIQNGGGTNSSIHRASALPKTANEGDIVYYCPPPNTLTSADSNRKVHINFSELERLMKDLITSNRNTTYPCYWILNLKGDWNDDYFTAGRISVVAGEDMVEEGRFGLTVYCMFGYIDYQLCWNLIEEKERFELSEEQSGVLKFDDDYNFEMIEQLSPLCDSFLLGTIVDKDIYLEENSEDEKFAYGNYGIFQAEPRFYQYTNGVWQETELPQLQ